MSATAELRIYEAAQIKIGQRLGGIIYNDSRNKFPDGTFVTTSPVADVEENKVCTVSGTVYTIVRITHDDWVAAMLVNE